MILARSEASKENPGAKKQSSRGRKTPLNAHYFSSFFWTKLTEEGYEKGRLAKWTKKVSLYMSPGYDLLTMARSTFSPKMSYSYQSTTATLIGLQPP